MFEYTIKYEPVIKDGNEYPQYNIYYYNYGELYNKEFYAKDLNNPELIIPNNYKKSLESL